MKNICDMTIKEISEMSSADRLEELSVTIEKAKRIHDIPCTCCVRVPLIPYTIEEALDDLREGEVDKVQYTRRNTKYLLRYNEERNCFEYSEVKNISWTLCPFSYLRMKTWKDISIYREEPEDKKEFDFWGCLTEYGLKKKLKDLDIDCIFEVGRAEIYFFIKKNKDRKKIKKHIFPHISGLVYCEIKNINNYI